MSVDDDAVDEEVHDFREQLDDGTSWEERLRPAIRKQLMNIQIDQVDFEDDPEAQLYGIDLILSERSFEDVQVKTRANKWIDKDDICIEVRHESIPDGYESDGWIYEFDKFPVIVAYCWKNKIGDNLADGVLLLIDEFFIDWFDGKRYDDEDGYDEIRNKKPSYDPDTGRRWWTWNCYVPIDDIPPGFIYPEFGDVLPLPYDEISTQSKLGGLTLCFHPRLNGGDAAECPDCGATIGGGD